MDRLSPGKQRSPYNSDNKTLELVYPAEKMPFIIVTHHKTFENVKKFLLSLDDKFETMLF